MKRIAGIGLATLGALAVAIAGSIGTATADPTEFDNGCSNAETTINALKAQGYNVVLNGAPVHPLSGCKVTVFGHLAPGQIKRTDEGGKGLATAALIISYSPIIIFAAIFVVYAILVAFGAK
jgi:hypothetical protein